MPKKMMLAGKRPKSAGGGQGEEMGQMEGKGMREAMARMMEGMAKMHEGMGMMHGMMSGGGPSAAAGRAHGKGGT